MKDTYEIIELQFYKDIVESQRQLEQDKSIVEEIMKENSVDYALELVENQKRSYYGEAFSKGYTLNLIIRKIDLHYVLKLLDENKIGFFENQEEKQAAINENDIYIEDEIYEDEVYEEKEEPILTKEEIERRNEVATTYTRIFFSIIFMIILSVEVFLGYWLYCIKLYIYLFQLTIFIVAQIIFVIYFLYVFRKKIDRL